MEMNEMYLKTAFCCMACDGSIANEEVAILKQYISTNGTNFQGLDVESKLNSYVEDINTQGNLFLKTYLTDIAEKDLSESEQLNLLCLAISIIEADKNIEYSEIAFFKKIRQKLSISDEKILAAMPDKGDYLLPDIMDDSPFDWLPASFNSFTIN